MDTAGETLGWWGVQQSSSLKTVAATFLEKLMTLEKTREHYFTWKVFLVISFLRTSCTSHEQNRQHEHVHVVKIGQKYLTQTRPELHPVDPEILFTWAVLQIAQVVRNESRRHNKHPVTPPYPHFPPLIAPEWERNYETILVFLLWDKQHVHKWHHMERVMSFTRPVVLPSLSAVL